MKIEASTLIHTYVVSKYMYMIALASKEQAGLKPNKPGGMLSYQEGTSLGKEWSVATVNLNKSENLVINTTAESKFIQKRPRICSN